MYLLSILINLIKSLNFFKKKESLPILNLIH